MKKINTSTICLLLICLYGYSQIKVTYIETFDTDVLVYGATPSGIMTALTVKKAGYEVLIVIPGMQVDYPDGDWETQSKIWQGYIDHVKTLTDFSGADVRLLSDYREETGGWPYLYMRGGRRMIGEYVMTQHGIQLQTEVPNPIGLGYYKVDIYPPRLAIDNDGVLVQEGDVFPTASSVPYKIPYGAIIPRRNEISNLLVPMMMSTSQVAYSSIRMEATYIVMGESAGIASSLAIKTNKAVQDIDRDELTTSLKAHGPVLDWDGKGYRKWRWNILAEPIVEITRWGKHPEEYQNKSIKML